MRKLKNSELERISVENFKSSNKTPIVVVLDNVRSALNVGSAFRTSDAFRIEKVYLCGITSAPPNKEISNTIKLPGIQENHEIPDNQENAEDQEHAAPRLCSQMAKAHHTTRERDLRPRAHQLRRERPARQRGLRADHGRRKGYRSCLCSAVRCRRRIRGARGYSSR